MQRINVVGTSGSGKSTISRLLSEKLGYPYVELDALFWKQDWGESTDEEFFIKIENALKSITWVLDGNYTRSTPIKWAHVDTVIWIDYSFIRTFYQAVTRALVRSLAKHELWSGNVESFSRSFLSRESVILWTIKTYKPKRQQYLDTMANLKYQHINFVRLTSPKEAKEYVRNLST